MDVKCNMVIISNVPFPVPSSLMLRVEDREVKDFSCQCKMIKFKIMAYAL